MVTIFMKPTNSPTQGQPSPRKMRLNKWHSGHFLPQQIIFHWFQIGTRLQETQTNHTVRKRPNDRLVLIFPVWSLHFPFGPYISRLVLTFPAWSLPGMFPVWSLHFPLGPYLIYFLFVFAHLPPANRKTEMTKNHKMKPTINTIVSCFVLGGKGELPVFWRMVIYLVKRAVVPLHML